MSDSIQVAIKVRPLIKREKDENLQVQWAVVDNVISPIDPEKKRGESGFQFDHIFDSNKKNNDIFEIVVKPIVDAAVNGFNGTVFAYGQTSSGKTHTMLGTSEELGVIPMAVERMFDTIDETVAREFLLRVSYLEIYNEKVNDLLDTNGKDLRLREDSNGLVQVINCKEEIASSPEVIMSIMKKGDKNRRIGETDMNERSSRSHTIFRITIESRDTKDDSDGAIQVSQLNLVDLAGSERARQTNATGERFKEGTHINMSLSTLGLVIKQLSESSDGSKYINFRDSKLTRLLQASLGGNAMTTIICAVTPAAFDETQCTLSFAYRAKSVKNKPQLNEVMSDAALLKRYKKQLAKLNEELEKLKNEKGFAEVQEMESKLLEKESKLQETDKINQMLEERIELLKNSIVSASSVIKDDSNPKIFKNNRRRTWGGDHRPMSARYSLCTRNLPTIQEVSSTSPKSKFNGTKKFGSINTRKSIIQTVDLNEQSFETAFADFELELIKVQKEREQESNVTLDHISHKINPKSENRVKFQDDVEVRRISSGSNWSEETLENQWSCSNQSDQNQDSSGSPGTPKSTLRERLQFISEEYEALKEFTTLERQMLSAQQLNFESPSEKVIMQQQIEQLQVKLEKYNTYQSDLEEQLAVSLSCINGLSSRTPDVLELWKPSLFNDEKGEIDVYGELKQLQELLTTLKNEQGTSERELTALEKKLTNDYNECLKELELIQSQKDSLLNENIEIKKKLQEESKKLKNVETIANTLRIDTDCLMQKLLEKNNELASLKEKVVELERLSSQCITSTISTQGEDENKILKLNETINGHIFEINKLKQMEEEVKKGNELLQKSNNDKANEITKLQILIQEQSLSIQNHQKTDAEMKQKIEELQKCLDELSNSNSKSQDQSEHQEFIAELKNKVIDHKEDEITKLTDIIAKQTADIENLKLREKEMQKEIELQKLSSNSEIENKCQVCQTLLSQDQESDNKMQVDLCKDSEMSKLRSIIEEKTLEIAKYIQSEEEAQKKIKYLESSLSSINSAEISNKESQTKELLNNSNVEINTTNHLIRDKCNKASNILEIIQIKSAKMEQYKQSIDEMIHENDRCKRLKEYLLDKIRDLQQNVNTQTESIPTESPMEIDNEMDIDEEKDDEMKEKILVDERYQLDEEEKVKEEISKLSSIIQLTESKHEHYKQLINVLKKEIEDLQEELDSNANQTTVECQREIDLEVGKNDANINVEKDNEIHKSTEIIQNQTLAIENYKKLLSEMQKEIEILKKQSVSTEEVDYDNEKIAKELQMSKQIELHQEEIKTLKDQVEASKEYSANSLIEFETKFTSLNNELSAKVNEIENLHSLNSELKNVIETKTNEIVNLQKSFETKIQELEQKIDVIILERNELKEKFDFISTYNTTQDFEKESANLKMLINKLKSENEELKKHIQVLETGKVDLSIFPVLENDSRSPSPANLTPIDSETNAESVIESDIQSTSVVTEEIKNKSLDESKINFPVENKQSTSELAASVKAGPSDDDNFVKPTSILSIERKDSKIVPTDSNMSITGDDNFVKPTSILSTERKDSKTVPSDSNLSIVANGSITQSQKLELESSSIFANMTYFDNMEVSQDCTGLLVGMDESKDVSNISANIDTSIANPIDKPEPSVNIPIVNDSIKNISKVEDSFSVSINPSMSMSSFKVDNESFTLEELLKIKAALEKDNIRLSRDLKIKIQETEDIEGNIIDFKQTLEELQQTIYKLTNENVDMSKLLSEATVNNNELQSEIDTLRTRMASIAEEKATLKNELESIHEMLESERASTPIIKDDEIKGLILGYKEKIKNLTDENIELSTNVMDKIEELEKVKESKVQLYDHECTYKEKIEDLLEKVQMLEKENIELSSGLTEQIEECDKFRETVDIYKQQLETYKNQSCSEDTNDLNFLKDENTKLTSELIELRTKVIQLTRENTNLSINLALDNSDELNESTTSRRKSLGASLAVLQTSISEVKDSEVSDMSLSKKVKYLEEQVKHLTLLNKKLSELKMTSCQQCSHLKELNDSRRTLKLEVKSLNQKLLELQKDYDHKCTETEVLRKKASEDLNASLSFMDSTLNGSISDGVNVTIIEDKVKNLHYELEELKENHNKLSNQYKEKCNELEKLQLDNNILVNSNENSDSRRPKTPSRKNTRVHSLQKDIEGLTVDIQEIKKANAGVSVKLQKYISERDETLKEMESLKLLNEEMKKDSDSAKELSSKYEEKVKLLEEEVSMLYKQIYAANEKEKEIEAQKLEFEVRVESLLKEKSELESSLSVNEDKLKKDLEDCNNRLDMSKKENADLKNELQKLEDLIQQLERGTENSIEEKLKDEINAAKTRIVKEMKSLVSLSEDELRQLPKKSVNDIFVRFLNTILSKEKEIVTKLHEDFERNKRKLEEEKQQSIDAEKRANIWAKTLESDLEKIQSDFTDQENKNKRLIEQIHRLEENLKETYHENQQLHANINNLESDIQGLHNELDKKSKLTSDRDSALSVAQEKERMARHREEEWDNRLKHEKEMHEREINDLNSQLDDFRSMNEELKNTVEGLDAQVEHLKSIADMKSSDAEKHLREIKELHNAIEQAEEIYQQLKMEIQEKNKHIEDITGLMKIKCDMLTEYKTKVETMNPELENLQAQIVERRAIIDKYKEEIHQLKLENKKQLDVMQDKLSEEEIKSAGLTKQLNDLKNKNTALSTTIEELKDKCAELEREIANLQRKVRNSTSKVRVENEMQDLQDENRSLTNHLEGSYNRIKELQESKSQVQRELTEAHGKIALLEQELNTTKISLESLREKYNNMNLQNLREKYEQLLRDKNNVILEIEEKKMLIASKDQKLVEYVIEMDMLKKELEITNKEKSSIEQQISDLMEINGKLQLKIDVCNNEKDAAVRLIEEERDKAIADLRTTIEELKTKNKELDDEMDEMVSHIHKQENEIAELQDKLITGSLNGNSDRLKSLEDENEKLKIDLRVTELNYSKLQKEIVRLNSEKETLQSRMEDLNVKITELENKNLSRSSSKSNSPNTQRGMRRRRRSDIYNQNRNLDIDTDSRDLTDTDSPRATPTPPLIMTIDEECKTCSELRNRIREMSLDLVSSNNKITMLEVQLQAENFPYQMKCNELQENLLAVKTRNQELKLEIHKLQRALTKDSSRECQVCRHKSLNRRDQSVQVNPEISLTGVSSGIIEDHVKLQKMEKERNWMKDLCRSRAKKIKDLEQRIKELEGITII